MLYTGVGDLDAIEVEILHLGEIPQVFEPVIGNQCAEQVQALQVLHACYRSKRIIEHISVAEIERLQIDERLEVLGILDGGVIQPEMFELGERRQSLYSLVTDIEPGESGQTGAECLQLLHALVILK